MLLEKNDIIKIFDSGGWPQSTWRLRHTETSF